MRIPLEDRHLYALLALLVLAVFYGIYFAKVLAQKHRGIQTRQIGRRKEKSIHTVEVLMCIATLGAPIAQLLSIDLMYIGVLLLYGNLLTLCVSAFAIVMLHLQILQEERYLVKTFGAPYQEYCRRVSRYLGRK